VLPILAKNLDMLKSLTMVVVLKPLSWKSELTIMYTGVNVTNPVNFALSAPMQSITQTVDTWGKSKTTNFEVVEGQRS